MLPRLAEIDAPLEMCFAYYNRLYLCTLSFVRRPLSDVETDWQSSVIWIPHLLASLEPASPRKIELWLHVNPVRRSLGK